MLQPEFILVLCTPDGQVAEHLPSFQSEAEAYAFAQGARLAIVRVRRTPVALCYVEEVEGAEGIPPVVDLEEGTLCGLPFPEGELHPAQQIMHPGHVAWVCQGMAGWGEAPEMPDAEPVEEEWEPRRVEEIPPAPSSPPLTGSVTTPAGESFAISHACGHEHTYQGTLTPFAREVLPREQCPRCRVGIPVANGHAAVREREPEAVAVPAGSEGA